MKNLSQNIELDVVELCGKIAVLSRANEWNKIEHLIKPLLKKYMLLAYRQGMKDSTAEIGIRLQTLELNNVRGDTQDLIDCREAIVRHASRVKELPIV